VNGITFAQRNFLNNDVLSDELDRVGTPSEAINSLIGLTVSG
jgi:hypothetical protein